MLPDAVKNSITDDSKRNIITATRKPVRIKRKLSVPQVRNFSSKETDNVFPPSQLQEPNLALTEHSDFSNEPNPISETLSKKLPASETWDAVVESSSQMDSIKFFNHSILDNSNHDESLLAEMARLEQELTVDQAQGESVSLLDSRDNDDLMLEMEEFI